VFLRGTACLLLWFSLICRLPSGVVHTNALFVRSKSAEILRGGNTALGVMHPRPETKCVWAEPPWRQTGPHVCYLDPLGQDFAPRSQKTPRGGPSAPTKMGGSPSHLKGRPSAGKNEILTLSGPRAHKKAENPQSRSPFPGEFFPGCWPRILVEPSVVERFPPLKSSRGA